MPYLQRVLCEYDYGVHTRIWGWCPAKLYEEVIAVYYPLLGINELYPLCNVSFAWPWRRYNNSY